METTNSYSKKALWTGRVISSLCVLFLLFDAIMKILKTAQTVQGSTQIGWPASSLQTLGFVLLVCTILYVVPRTAILGAILLTGYLGGATSIMVRAAAEGHSFLFPVVFGILVWAGIFLRDEKLRSLIPMRKQSGAGVKK